MQLLRITSFEQCVLSISLINLCNSTSHVGQEMCRRYNAWNEETDEPIHAPWSALYQFTIFVPHPQQQYEGITLEAGLTQGYNVEVKPIGDRSQIPYAIPNGGHFVVVLRQKGLDAGFEVAATGIFVRPLALLSLDMIVDRDKPEYQSIVVKHPIIRDYPSDWEEKLRLFLDREIRGEDLPNLVGYVDQACNRDYRPPGWNEVHLAAKGFTGI